MKKNKKVNRNRWLSVKKLSFKHLLLTLVLGYGACRIVFNAYNSYRLKREGEYTVGVVHAMGKNFACFYNFKVGQRYYNGVSLASALVDVGDSIVIVYLPYNPNINHYEGPLHANH